MVKTVTGVLYDSSVYTTVGEFIDYNLDSYYTLSCKAVVICKLSTGIVSNTKRETKTH